MKSHLSTAVATAAVGLLCVAGTAQAADLAWVPNTDAKSGQNVVIGGKEPGRDLPICRAPYQNGIHPGKIVAGNCNFSWGGKEILANRFEVLTGGAGTGWVASRAGAPQPANAFIGGQEPGRLLPVCRAAYQKGVHPGKVVAGKCNIGWGGKEIVLTSYEVMTVGPVAAPAGGLAAAGAVVGVTGGESSKDDMTALLTALKSNMSEQDLGKLAGRVEEMRKAAEKLRLAGLTQIAIAEAKKKGQTPAQADGAIRKNFESLGLPYDKSWDANETALKKYAESLAAQSRKGSADLQSAIDKRNQAFDMMTDIIKKMHESQQKIIGSMR